MCTNISICAIILKGQCLHHLHIIHTGRGDQIGRAQASCAEGRDIKSSQTNSIKLLLVTGAQH